MSKSLRMSAARRRAETLLNPSQTRQDTFRQQQKRAHDAMVEKTARLRELRLAKEAADKEAEATNAPVTAAPKARKVRRSKQT